MDKVTSIKRRREGVDKAPSCCNKFEKGMKQVFLIQTFKKDKIEVPGRSSEKIEEVELCNRCFLDYAELNGISVLNV